MNSYYHDIAKKFLPEHTIDSIKALGNGLINKTLLVKGTKSSESKKIVLQKINKTVYPFPLIVIQNHITVSTELHQNDDEARLTSHLYKSIDGSYFFKERDNYWRAQSYLENVTSYDQVIDEHTAFEGAKMIGKFNQELSKYQHLKLSNPIDGFHDLRSYLKLFKDAMDSSMSNRLNNCSSEIRSLAKLEKGMLKVFDASRKLPSRICHYDTKINNILFDKKTKKAVQIIDLDNMMYGKVIFDFGDMMRTFISPVDENEKDVDKIGIRWEIVIAIINGYLSEANGMLTKEEKSMLISGGILITYEQAIRFLSDYLIGDKYYKIQYQQHNLIRTRNQLRLVELFLFHKEKLEELILKSNY